MTDQIELAIEPQWKRVLRMLQEKPQTTGDFCSTYGLASEYRRAISELRRKGHKITAEQVRKGSWVYRLHPSLQVNDVNT